MFLLCSCFFPISNIFNYFAQIRLLYRGNQRPTQLLEDSQNTKLPALSAQKQHAMGLMCRIYIGSINFNVTEDMIRSAFLPFGPVKHINMSFDLATNKYFC